MIGITERGDAALSCKWYKWVEDGNPAILITKNPDKLEKDFVNATGTSIFDKNVIIHCTITGLGGSKFEPGVHDPSKTLKWLESVDNAYYDSQSMMDKVVIRVDPIIPLRSTYNKAYSLVKEISDNYSFTRFRTSILDMYPHVDSRFKKILTPDEYSELESIYNGQMHAPLDIRQSMINGIKSCLIRDAELSICGEPGITCTGCVSQKDCDILGINTSDEKGHQRPACACLALKHELLDSKTRCAHKCAYCYWKD